MRVVAGALRGRKLVTPDGLSVRPTAERVRQATFNALEHRGAVRDARVVDLFAGSGALGIEGLSRGAATCVFVERDRAALHALRANIGALGLEQRTTVVTSDVPAWVPALRGIDLALIDPPYEFDGWERLLTELQAPYVVAEAGRPIEPPEGWQAVRSRR